MNERDEELARSVDPDAWRQLHKDDEDWCQQFADLIRADERNKLAAWMMAQGYATGHGDTMEGLLEELEREVGFKRAELWIKRINEAVLAEREACAEKTGEFARKWWSIHCESNKHMETTLKAHQDFCVLQAAIRARGQA